MATPPNYTELVRKALNEDRLIDALGYLSIALFDDEQQRDAIDELRTEAETIEMNLRREKSVKGGRVTPEMIEKRVNIVKKTENFYQIMAAEAIQNNQSSYQQTTEPLSNYESNNLFEPVLPIIQKEVLGGLTADADANYDISNQDTRRTDRLNIMNDVRAFADLIAYKGLQPPLAIGLFAQWGSGKSFFMEKMREEIYDRAEMAAKKPDKTPFHKNIVQVTFNAWHYNEDNLWASLVATIFGTLAAHANPNTNPNDPNQIAAQLEKELANYTAQVTQKEDELTRIKDELRNTEDEVIRRFGQTTLKNFETWWVAKKQEKIPAEMAKNLQMPTNISWSEAQKQAEDLHTWFGKVKKTATMLWNNPKLLILLVGILSLSILLPFCTDILMSVTGLAQNWFSELTKWVGMILPPIFAALQYIKPYWETITKYAAIFSNDMETIKKEDEAAFDKAKIAYETSKKKMEKTQQDLNDLHNGNRLLSFIQDKNQEDNYRKYLGIITMIRNDFAQLQSEMSFLKGKHPNFSVDRIVLYIDDLDRCPEYKVVEVLEAVHMLLGLDLFVVVVGVDPRWVKKALHNQLNLRLDELDKNNLLTATAYDYLEKIFQIPFRLNPLNSAGTSELVKFLLDTKTVEGGATTINSRGDLSVEDKPTANTSRNISNIPAVETTLPELKITTDEVEWIQALSPILSTTPRSVKRFANIYRILRVHQDTPAFSQDTHALYKGIVILLSIATGEGTKKMEDLLKWCIQNENKLLKDSDKMSFKILHQPLFENVEAGILLKHANLVRKFTFRESENIEKTVGFSNR